MTTETLWCESCGEVPQTISLAHAGLCDGCAETCLSEELTPILGYAPCATTIWPNGRRALCLEVAGAEHDHSELSPLAAAAPAMLDALRKIRAEIMAWADDDNPDGAPSPNELAARIAVTARAAIVAADPAGEAASAARFRNSYYCEACGTDWEDEWSCEVDDDCPKCGERHISPHESEELEGEG